MSVALWEEYNIYRDLINDINEIQEKFMRILDLARINDNDRNNIRDVLVSLRRHFSQRINQQKREIINYYRNH